MGIIQYRYGPNDKICRLVVRCLESFGEEFVRNRDLSTAIQIWSIDTKPRILPELDMRGYGLKLVAPRNGETVTSFPYQGKIDTYKGKA